ncbi:MAG: hypothetical protein QXX83_06635 [Thermofilum sp.]
MRPEVLASAEEVERRAELNRRAFEKLREELVRGREACTRLSLGVSSSEFFPTLEEAAAAFERVGARQGVTERLTGRGRAGVELGWSLVEL